VLATAVEWAADWAVQVEVVGGAVAMKAEE